MQPTELELLIALACFAIRAILEGLESISHLELRTYS